MAWLQVFIACSTVNSLAQSNIINWRIYFTHAYAKLQQETIPFSIAWWWHHTTTCHSEYNHRNIDIDPILPQSQTMDQTSEWQHDRFSPEAILLSDQQMYWCCSSAGERNRFIINNWTPGHFTVYYISLNTKISKKKSTQCRAGSVHECTGWQTIKMCHAHSDMHSITWPHNTVLEKERKNIVKFNYKRTVLDAVQVSMQMIRKDEYLCFG